jgi:hypothetical protein
VPEPLAELIHELLSKCADARPQSADDVVRRVQAIAEELTATDGNTCRGGHIAACTAIADAPNAETDDPKISCIPNGLLLAYPGGESGGGEPGGRIPAAAECGVSQKAVAGNLS